MRIEDRLFISIVRKYVPDPVMAAGLIAEVHVSGRVMADLAEVERDAWAEAERHRRATDAIGVRLEAVRAACRHPAAEYRGDPAGGSDGHHACGFCGKEW